jgi:hypothetical protein
LFIRESAEKSSRKAAKAQRSLEKNLEINEICVFSVQPSVLIRVQLSGEGHGQL